MKQELKNIKTGIGLGLLKFGMTRNEIKSIIGDPDEINSHSYTDDEKELTETWNYNKLKLSINFEEEYNWKLLVISVYSDFYQFNNHIFAGLNKNSLLKQLNNMEINDYIIEDWSSIEIPDFQLIEVDSQSINFWLNTGILNEIQWYPNFTDDDKIKWPD